MITVCLHDRKHDRVSVSGVIDPDVEKRPRLIVAYLRIAQYTGIRAVLCILPVQDLFVSLLPDALIHGKKRNIILRRCCTPISADPHRNIAVLKDAKIDQHRRCLCRAVTVVGELFSVHKDGEIFGWCFRLEVQMLLPVRMNFIFPVKTYLAPLYYLCRVFLSREDLRKFLLPCDRRVFRNGKVSRRCFEKKRFIQDKVRNNRAAGLIRRNPVRVITEVLKKTLRPVRKSREIRGERRGTAHQRKIARHVFFRIRPHENPTAGVKRAFLPAALHRIFIPAGKLLIGLFIHLPDLIRLREEEEKSVTKPGSQRRNGEKHRKDFLSARAGKKPFLSARGGKKPFLSAGSGKKREGTLRDQE